MKLLLRSKCVWFSLSVMVVCTLNDSYYHRSRKHVEYRTVPVRRSYARSSALQGRFLPPDKATMAHYLALSFVIIVVTFPFIFPPSQPGA